MADIKLTLGRRPNRAPSVEVEAERMHDFAPLYYPLGGNGPKHAQAGCWVYFIRAGELVGRARADRFERIDPPMDGIDAAEQPSKIKGWQVVCSTMELARRRVPAEGFQAFRYVQPGEAKAFEGAFRRVAAGVTRRAHGKARSGR